MDFKVLLLFIASHLTLVLFTSIAPFFIKRCSASMFNISLVSQIFWSFLVELITTDNSPKGFEYFIGFGVIILGIVIFSIFPIISLQNNNSHNEHKLTYSSKNVLEDPHNNIYVKSSKEESLNLTDSMSESCFAAVDKKYAYYKQNMSSKATKYLNNQ